MGLCSIYPLWEANYHIGPIGDCGLNVDNIYQINYWNNLLLDTGYFRDEYEKTVVQTRDFLNSKYGSRLTENIVFGHEWRRQAMAGDILPGLESPDAIGVNTIYSFSESPDFLIIRFSGTYEHQVLAHGCYTPMRAMAYLPELDTIFLPDRSGTFDLDETYDYWVSNSKDLRNLDPICISALLLHWKNNEKTVFVIDSLGDILIAKTINNLLRGGIGTSCPDRAGLEYDGLFYMDVSHIIDIYPNLDCYIEEMREYIDMCNGWKAYRDFEYHSPQIYSDSIKTVVKMIALIEYELAEWEIILSPDNHLISMRLCP